MSQVLIFVEFAMENTFLIGLLEVSKLASLAYAPIELYMPSMSNSEGEIWWDHLAGSGTSIR